MVSQNSHIAFDLLYLGFARSVTYTKSNQIKSYNIYSSYRFKFSYIFKKRTRVLNSIQSFFFVFNFITRVRVSSHFYFNIFILIFIYLIKYKIFSKRNKIVHLAGWQVNHHQSSSCYLFSFVFLQ